MAAPLEQLGTLIGRDPTGEPQCQQFRVPPRHDVAEVAGLTSFSFGDDEDSRYVMVFKKVGDGRRHRGGHGGWWGSTW